jgi:hypothetical protein
MKNSIDELEARVPFLKKVTQWDKGGVKGTVKFLFGNGTKLVCKIADCSESNQARATAHGISQKVGDSAAGFSKTLNYAGAFEACSSVIEQLATEEWNSGRDAFGGIADLIQAVANIKGRTAEDVAKAYDAISIEERKTWLKPAVRAEVLAIRAARAQEAVGAETAELEIAGFE